MAVHKGNICLEDGFLDSYLLSVGKSINVLMRNEILSTVVIYLVVLFLLFHIHATVLINTELPLYKGKSIVIHDCSPFWNSLGERKTVLKRPFFYQPGDKWVHLLDLNALNVTDESFTYNKPQCLRRNSVSLTQLSHWREWPEIVTENGVIPRLQQINGRSFQHLTKRLKIN